MFLGLIVGIFSPNAVYRMTFTDGKFSMMQYLESFCMDNTFWKIFIGYFIEAVEPDSKVYW